MFYGISLNSQNFTWFVTEDKEDTVKNSSLEIKLKKLKLNDSVLINGRFLKIGCQTGDSVIIQCFLEGDTILKYKFCNLEENIKIIANKSDIVSSSGNQLTIYFKKIINDGKQEGQPTNVTFNQTLIKSSLYYDAHLLLYSKNDALRKSIIKKYEITNDNKFINTIDIEIKRRGQSGLFGAKGNGNTSTISSLSSSIFGLDVTSLADGLAKFLVSRVKKEMAIALFDDLSRRIRSDSTKDIQVLFKNTYGILDLLGERIYDFHPYISSLRQNMEYDFQNMPESFQILLEDSSSHIHKLLKVQRNLLYVTGNSLDLALEIKENTHFGKALGLHDFKKYKENGDTSLIGSFQALQLFSEALRDTFTSDTMPYWVDKSNINKLVNDKDLLICFMGLFVEVVKKKDINIRPNLTLYNYLNDSIGPERVMRFHNFLISLQNSISQIQQIHPKYRNASTEDDKKLQVVNYFDAAHSLIKTSEDLVNLFTKKISGDLKTFYSMADNINGVIKFAVTKKYTLSAMHLAKIMASFDRSDKVVFKTISFIVDKSLIIGQLAEAKTADEVKEVIESFAAPVGSWRDKRIASFNMAIDSYVGPGYISPGNQSNTEVKYSNWVVSTPVGLSASIKLRGIGSFSLMGSILDIGPLTAKRFSTDTVSIGKIYLKEILAPGILVSLGLGKRIPITFNGGYQQFPLLKKVGEDSDLINKHGWSFSINANIPILTLMNNSGHKVRLVKKICASRNSILKIKSS